MTHQTEKERLDTILVIEVGGQVTHTICTQTEGQERLRNARIHHSGGSMFTSEGMSADLVYSVSPNLRERVDEAKRKLRGEILIRDALDRNAVPRDHALRTGIYKAINELRATWLQSIV